ncbi:alpha/beta fold hydrolase [Psychrobacillus sp. OK032]|uniref:alpha/beta fold hydrolase n=1 Tax=Psychrobacillus sp. OK032 TaxID=1884358 RepID=UPI0008BD21FB|nr:alpha/beta hydrolase [Psychrobacillus sp. OK032]SES37063.1 Pimeloyl-ACP methyl ester carboxylesterase [Psychrobacillus sp. OK032]
MTVSVGKYVEVDPGVELYVQDIGSGDPIVFIPGFTFTTEVFTHQVEHFAKTNRVIVIDPRSHGRSSITLQGNDYVTHGTDLAKVLDALQLKNVTLAGWSFGCLTVWEYLKQNGYDNVKSLIFIDMSPKALSTNDVEDWVEGPLGDIGAIYNTYLRNPAGQREFMKAYTTSVMVQRDVTEDELNWLVEQSLKTPYYIAANLFASGMFSDYREEANEASETVPTLTIVADHWADTAIAFTQKNSPKTSIEVLGGHLMFWEHSEKFNKLVEKFLKA